MKLAFGKVETSFDVAAAAYSDMWLTEAARVIFMSYFIELPALDQAGLTRAWQGLNVQPDFILVDARRIPNCQTPQRGIIRGDALSASIAAASIIAKTTRDAHMIELDQLYSGYGLAAHKGYPTPEHCRTLKDLGALPIHRRSFARVRQALGLDPIQAELFGTEEEIPQEVQQEMTMETSA